MTENPNSFQLVSKDRRKLKHEMSRNILVIGMVAIAVGIILALVMRSPLHSILSYAGGFVCILVTFIFRFKSKTLLQKGILITVIYFAFIYIPIDWYLFGGILGSTPYVSLMVVVVMATVFSKKKQKILIPAYFVLILALAAHSIADEIYSNSSARISEIIITLVAYFALIVFMLFMRRTMLGSLEKRYRKTFDDSIKDKLTGTLNRRALDDVLDIAESKYQSKKVDYTVVMIDVDMLKELNDKLGHASGDLLLKRLANCIEQSVRAVDYVLRYGGDEFLILLQNIPKVKVKTVFNRIEGFLHDEYLAHDDFQVSFSRGFAQRKECDSQKDIVETADKRMYEYKYSHRDD
ncbi:MAG: GGDEF domain-containing protein [Clostridia bacterium]|nr:GGDEF domain-containing protein [Clostridia bacterium]MBT7122579.1 GGDEF domain-containing protein [Clostridia bacterium]